MSKSFNQQHRQFKQKNQGLASNPLFYFGMAALFLWALPFFSLGSLADLNDFKGGDAAILNSFFLDAKNLENNDLFFSQSGHLAKESPDFKIIQNNFIYGVSTPRVLTTQTLGNLLTESPQSSKEILNHTVVKGDTIKSVAQQYGRTEYTVYINNNLSKNSILEIGQSLIILPIDGGLYEVASGDTVGQIARDYKAKEEDIIEFNGLTYTGDIMIGDPLIIPYGTKPVKLASLKYKSVPNSYYGYPIPGAVVTQGAHGPNGNGVDFGAKLNTPVYAVASGVVQRVKYGWNFGAGNYITILHPNGTVSHYGHAGAASVKPGESVYMGQTVGFVGMTGITTGPHLHFHLSGARNPFLGMAVGAIAQ